ncbi:MAG: efflux RND transporter periplasmic adaptor subunit [Hyphomicrobiales bacterium]|nr:efflux RND transporter periplasmic adaptor subunit [Hyphomicrobiales bacterium]
MSRYLRWLVGIALLAVVAAGALYWRALSELPVQVAVLERGVEVRVFGIGTVEAQVTSKVGFQVGGRVVALAADQGDFVKAGTLLARLDDDAQRAKLMKSEAAQRQAAANLLRVKAQRDRVEANYLQKKNISARRKTLVDRGAVSQEAADDALTAEKVASSDMDVVEAELAIANVAQDDAAAQQRLDTVLLAQHELHAPFDARVISRHKELGSIVNAGEAVFTLIPPESIWVRTFVDESLAGGIAVGQTALVRLRSEAGRTVETEVVRIDQENDRVTEERRLYVRCRACRPEHQLRFLGERAEVEIVKRVIPSGLFVPLRLVEGYDGRSGRIWVLREGRLAKARVQLGDRLLDGRIHIESGLPEDAAVVIEDTPGLREGRRARADGGGGS